MFISNPIVYLFDKIEEQSGMKLATFTTNEIPHEEFHEQPYMQQYQSLNQTNNNPSMYKYIYDPNLEFDFRFHQRIASMKYSERNYPWVTIMFNTKQVRPQTNVISHKYKSYTTVDQGFFKIDSRRVSVPVNMVFISNDISYLYTFLENISFYWDRISNFPYKQAIQYTDDYKENYNQVGQAVGITPINLEKLDTQRRGSLATAAYSFDLVYFDHAYADRTMGHLLKTIDLRVIVVDDISSFNLVPQQI
jgi:hypothetical protein